MNKKKAAFQKVLSGALSLALMIGVLMACPVWAIEATPTPSPTPTATPATSGTDPVITAYTVQLPLRYRTVFKGSRHLSHKFTKFFHAFDQAARQAMCRNGARRQLDKNTTKLLSHEVYGCAPITGFHEPQHYFCTELMPRLL